MSGSWDGSFDSQDMSHDSKGSRAWSRDHGMMSSDGAMTGAAAKMHSFDMKNGDGGFNPMFLCAFIEKQIKTITVCERKNHNTTNCRCEYRYDKIL